MLGNRSGSSVAVSDCGGVEEDYRVFGTVLVLLGEVSVVDVTGH